MTGTYSNDRRRLFFFLVDFGVFGELLLVVTSGARGGIEVRLGLFFFLTCGGVSRVGACGNKYDKLVFSRLSVLNVDRWEECINRCKSSSEPCLRRDSLMIPRSMDGRLSLVVV